MFPHIGTWPLILHMLPCWAGESVQKPHLYYNNNLIGTIILLEVMAAYHTGQ